MWHGVRRSDAVITSFLWNSYTLYLLVFAFLLRKPVTVWEERSKFSQNLIGKVHYFYYRVMQHFVTNFFTLGEVQKNSMLGVGIQAEHIFVANEYPGLVYSEVTPKPFDLPGKGAENRVLFLGRLITVKGVDMLLRAFALLLQRRPETTLLIVGTGPELKLLLSLSQELGMAERVAFLGAITDPAQKSYLFRECAVMAVPSVTNGGESEGGPLVVLEALSAGLPVVSSNAVGSSERFVAAQDPRLVVPERSVDMLCEALNLVLSERERFLATAKSVFHQVPSHAFQFAVLERAVGGESTSTS
jgi:glycosyltransferase involved in cell wall biosynthesis